MLFFSWYFGPCCSKIWYSVPFKQSVPFIPFRRNIEVKFQKPISFGLLTVGAMSLWQVNYQAGGWVTHHVSDIWAKSSAFLKNPKHAVWPMGGAWLCTHLWEHYQFSMDKVGTKSLYYSLILVHSPVMLLYPKLWSYRIKTIIFKLVRKNSYLVVRRCEIFTVL